MKRCSVLLLVLVLVLGVVCCLSAPVRAAQGAFSDVAPDAWYAETVADMTEAGWLSGYPDGTFQPQKTISGAEFVTVVARCAALSPTTGQTAHWASGTLQAALNAGWYDWDELPPTGEQHDAPIPRQLAIKILMKALLPEARGDYAQQAHKLQDLSDLNGRYYDAVFAAYAAGVVTGDDRGYFHPQQGLTRAEACAIIQRATAQRTPSDTPQPDTPTTPPVQEPVTPVQGGVSQNGWLQVKGTRLCNQAGEPVVLHGMSSHGVQWYPQFTSQAALANTARYGANLFRVAMYTEEGGYLHNPKTVLNQTIQAVEAAIAQDMYVIVDWHILSDGNPMTHLTEAKAFFTEMATRYGDNPAVLFEICNEPNGNITWAGDVKPYAQAVVATIRQSAPRSVILIGSPTWSQDLHLAAADPVSGTNLMYTCHFYAGTHGQWLRDRIDTALAAGLPIFISEWGTSASDGNGGVFLPETAQWLDFLKTRNISWANWSLCDKNESSAALNPGTNPGGVWTEKDLSASGKVVFGGF